MKIECKDGKVIAHINMSDVCQQYSKSMLHEYTRIGELTLLKIFNFVVFARVGNIRKLFWISWAK